MVHAFPVLGHLLLETRRSLDVISEFVLFCCERADLPTQVSQPLDEVDQAGETDEALMLQEPVVAA
ncbi:hypothetical protein, partial [Nocardia salmonicida]|uniref:hypothetical protein n=1 Tax=Nocardia salmonicida TaxID=53431 RepID=UPI0033EF00D3